MARLQEHEIDFGVILQFRLHLLDTAAPGLDEFHVLKDWSQDPVSDLASASAQFFKGEKVGQGAGAGDLQHIVIDGHFYITSENGVIPVYDRIDHCFADGIQGILPAILAVYLAYGRAKSDIFLDEDQARFYGGEDGFINCGLIQKDPSFRSLDPGAFDLGIGEILFPGLRVRQEKSRISRITLSPLCMEQTEILNQAAFYPLTGSFLKFLFKSF